MMLISMIQDLDACTSDAGFFRVGRTNGQGDSRSWMYFFEKDLSSQFLCKSSPERVPMLGMMNAIGSVTCYSLVFVNTQPPTISKLKSKHSIMQTSAMLGPMTGNI